MACRHGNLPSAQGAAFISIPQPRACSEPTLQPSAEVSILWMVGHTSFTPSFIYSLTSAPICKVTGHFTDPGGIAG